MGRVAATAVHLTLSAVAIALYVLFVLPRWWELMGDTSHTLGTVLRIVTGLLFAAAALPVVMTLLRTKKPELDTPQLALNLRLSAAIAHVMAGALILGAAIAEIWVSYDTSGAWLGGIYGTAAALAILGIAGFYLAFVADLPPALPKEKQASKEKQAPEEKKAPESGPTESDTDSEPAEGEPEDDESATAATEDASAEEASSEDGSTDAPSGLRNKRPSGKSGNRLRRGERTNVSVQD